MKSPASAFAALLLAACTTIEAPVPPIYAGPVARLDDSGIRESGAKAQLFAATAIDGRSIANASGDTYSASRGQGFAMSMALTSRQVPARAMRITLLGTHQTAAPIHEIASRAAGTFFSVEGVVDFQPEGGRHYIVKGDLKKAGSSVWIEEKETGRVVTEKVVGK